MRFQGPWRCKGANEECEGRQNPCDVAGAAGCVQLGVCTGASGN